MLCENCGKREANVRYSENINGRKREMNLCEECSQKLGINNMHFNMPLDFPSFLGDFMEDFARPEYMPLINEMKTLKCENCGYTFDDIVNTGRLGCASCYDIFETQLDPIIRRIQNSNRHVGRIGKVLENNIEKRQIDKKENNKLNIQSDKISDLKEQLKEVIKEEKYEEAAKLRDEIKKLEKKDEN